MYLIPRWRMDTRWISLIFKEPFICQALYSACGELEGLGPSRKPPYECRFTDFGNLPPVIRNRD